MIKHFHLLLVSSRFLKMKPIDMGLLIQLRTMDSTYQVRNFVEKPKQGTAPSNLAIMGRYIFTPEIFMFLENKKLVQVEKFN